MTPLPQDRSSQPRNAQLPNRLADVLESKSGLGRLILLETLELDAQKALASRDNEPDPAKVDAVAEVLRQLMAR